MRKCLGRIREEKTMRSSIVVKLWNQKNNTLQGTNISPSPALLSRWFSVSFPFGWDMRSFLWIVIFIDVGCGVSSRMIILKYPENRQDDNFKREKPSWKPFTVGRFPTHQTYRKKKKCFFFSGSTTQKNPAYGVGDWYSPLKLWFENLLNNLLVVNCLGKIWLRKTKKTSVQRKI